MARGTRFLGRPSLLFRGFNYRSSRCYCFAWRPSAKVLRIVTLKNTIATRLSLIYVPLAHLVAFLYLAGIGVNLC